MHSLFIETERDKEGELVRLDYDIDTDSGEKAVKVLTRSIYIVHVIRTVHLEVLIL